MSIESVMPSNHRILCRPLLLRPPIPPSIRVFIHKMKELEESLVTSLVRITCINAGIKGVVPRCPWPVPRRTAGSLTLECGVVFCPALWTRLLVLLPKERGWGLLGTRHSWPPPSPRGTWGDLVSLSHCFLTDVTHHGECLIGIQRISQDSLDRSFCMFLFYPQRDCLFQSYVFILLTLLWSKNIFQTIRKKQQQQLYFTLKSHFKKHCPLQSILNAVLFFF